MACTGSEEECRRQCIVNPASCGGIGQATTQQEALTKYLHAEVGGSVSDCEHLAKALLNDFCFAHNPNRHPPHP